MKELALFAAAFVTVFSLGFQRQNVVHGHFRAAFVTSFLIGGSQIVLWRFVPDASWSQIAATLAGGPFGIVASMHVHRRWMKRPAHGGAGAYATPERAFIKSLLHPEEFGWSVTQEVRDRARCVLGIGGKA